MVMKRSAMAPRTKPIRAVNTKRKKKRSEINYGVDYGRWLRSQWCEVTKRTDDLVAAHVVRSRGAAGKEEDMVPLHRTVEQDWHYLDEEKFERRHNRTKQSVKDAAFRWRERYMCEQNGEPYDIPF
jgi:hypothetical protein